VTIGGFVIAGSTSKRVMIRALGPTLTSAGVSGALADPSIEVYRGSNVIAQNDNWSDSENASQLSALAASLGAGPIASGDTTSSATILTLPPGAYTAIIRGRNASSGIALFEVFDADFVETNSIFANIATRAYATTGDGAAIGGFVISGSTDKRVLIRAVGPTLASLGLPAAETLADPTMQFHRPGNTPLAVDNWSSAANSGDIVTVGTRVGAGPFAAPDTKSSAHLVSLAPGAYTTVVTGIGSTSGIVLVEVFDAD
jgi:hypothetical protein